MIGYIQGKLLSKETERILVLANQIGYEVMLPPMVMHHLNDRNVGDEVALYIFYQQTERQPKPVLIGFTNELEKDFFQQFISVEDIGPMKALKSLTIPVHEIAHAIESRDAARLQQLKGIGKRTAQKIIAALHGKLERFLLPGSTPQQHIVPVNDLAMQVTSVLVEQLGFKIAEARKMVSDALKRNQTISTPEELFDEVMGGTAAK